MNYYDHAVMIAYRLGPWAEPGRHDHLDFRSPPRRKQPSAIIRLIRAMYTTLVAARSALPRPDDQPGTQSRAGKSAH
jgi:hypothetical protein